MSAPDSLVARYPFPAALVGMALLASMDALVKGLSGAFPTFQIVFLRYAVTAVLVGGAVAIAGYAWPQRDRLSAHGVRALLMVVTNTTFFYALGRMPLADLFALSFTSPIFTAIAAALYLKEPIGRNVAIAIGVGFIGMLVIVFGGSASVTAIYPPLALAAALASPVTYALSIVLLRAQTAGEPIPVIVAVQALIASLLLMPFAAAQFVWPDALEWASFVAMGLIGAIGYLAFVSGLKHMAAARFSVVEYTGLLWAVVFGYAFFSEVPSANIWLGAALIIASCLSVARGRSLLPLPVADRQKSDMAARIDP